jgi:hypothetical protein
MMELLTKLGWGLLVLIHASPAAVLFAPSLVRRLYGVEATGDIGVLLVHRGALFLAIAAVCLYAAFEPSARRAAGIVASISVIGFLIVYVRAGIPEGALRTIAVGDLMAIPPLVLVLYAAWRSQAA